MKDFPVQLIGLNHQMTDSVTTRITRPKSTQIFLKILLWTFLRQPQSILWTLVDLTCRFRSSTTEGQLWRFMVRQHRDLDPRPKESWMVRKNTDEADHKNVTTHHLLNKNAEIADHYLPSNHLFPYSCQSYYSLRAVDQSLTATDLPWVTIMRSPPSCPHSTGRNIVSRQRSQ